MERSEASDKTYDRILTGIRFELELMSARVNWLLSSQSFLFVPLAIGSEGQPLAQNPLVPHIPLIGLGLCLVLTVSIMAALLRLAQWRSKLSGTGYADEQTPGEFSGIMPSSPVLPALGVVGALGVPLILIAAWSWILFSLPTWS